MIDAYVTENPHPIDAASNGLKALNARIVVRMTLAVLSGVVAGVLLPGSFEVGVRFLFPAEPEWSGLLWGEHWIIRVSASCAAAAGAGFIAGAIARHRSRAIAILTVVPALCVWLLFSISAWREQVLFTEGLFYVSIGNKLAASAVVLALVPAALLGETAGAEFGDKHGRHFDSRRATLLGIKWYHYLWLPLVLHLFVAQAAWAALYGFEWLKIAWRSGAHIGSMIPFIFLFLMWGTFVLFGAGLSRAYGALAGMQVPSSTWTRAKMVFKYGFGFPLLAALLQAGIVGIHYALSRLFS